MTAQHSSRGTIPFIRTAPAALFLILIVLSGCQSQNRQEWQRVQAEQAATIQALNDELARLNQELDELLQSREDLANAKSELERKLQSELGSGDLSLSMQSRGLVLTVLDRVLFDSGKAELKPSSMETLTKVAGILADKVADHMVFVEGHTDNVPIRYSGWRSNWELSTARATEVVHHFVDQDGIDPRRLAATGYGEFHPVTANDTDEERGKNRRVEIVISPRKVLAPVPGAAG
jgi:chemotaxis protein MotB